MNSKKKLQNKPTKKDGFIKETPSLRVAIGYALPFWNEPFGVDNAIYFWDHFEDEVDSN